MAPGDTTVGSGPSWKIGDSAYKSMIKNPRVLQAEDLVPNITQKGVDLRIGLDIARLSLRQLVSTIVVVTGDSDLIPAFKFARREGLRIVLDAMGHSIRRESQSTRRYYHLGSPSFHAARITRLLHTRRRQTTTAARCALCWATRAAGSRATPPRSACRGHFSTGARRGLRENEGERKKLGVWAIAFFES